MILRRLFNRKSASGPKVKMTRSEKWNLFFAIFAGKMIGVAMVIAAMMMIPGLLGLSANAAEVYTPHETMTINAINTIWTLVAAALVFGMQAGFVMLEAGFARKRETVNILVECALDTAICGVFFWAIGYAFMFSHGNGFIGYNWFFLQGVPLTYE